MNNMPKKFPEYLIMYKTITKRILDLENEKTKLPNSTTEEIQNKIEKYKVERTKIINMFPENFFNSYSAEE
jgi:hypothetical protein